MIAGLNVWHNGAGGGPLIMALHGACATGKIWKEVSELFGNRIRFFAPDLPGHGTSRSYKPLGKTSIEEYAEELVALCYTFMHERIKVLAHSMGGLVALELANRVPNISRIVLLNSAPPQALITPRTALRALKYLPSFLYRKPWIYTESDFRHLLCTSRTGMDMQPKLARLLYQEAVYESGKAALQMCLGRIRPLASTSKVMVVAADGDRVAPIHFQQKTAKRYQANFFEFPGTHLSVFDPSYAWVFDHHVIPWLLK